jgi:hypothetical protein
MNIATIGLLFRDVLKLATNYYAVHDNLLPFPASFKKFPTRFWAVPASFKKLNAKQGIDKFAE